MECLDVGERSSGGQVGIGEDGVEQRLSANVSYGTSPVSKGIRAMLAMGTHR